MDSYNELNDSMIFIKHRNTALLLQIDSLTALESFWKIQKASASLLVAWTGLLCISKFF